MIYKAITETAQFLIKCFIKLGGGAKSDKAAWFQARLHPQPLAIAPQLWLHAVSVGEAKLAQALWSGWPADCAQTTLFTCSTPSAYRWLVEQVGEQFVRPMPFDLARSYAALFLDLQVPDLIIIETEIWPELYRFVAARERRIVIVNARLSSKTTRWSRLPLLRKALQRVTQVCARNALDAKRFQSMGVSSERISICGNLKYDYAVAGAPKTDLAQWLEAGPPLVVFASVSADEAALLAPVAKHIIHAGWRVLWAPRHLDSLASHLRALNGIEVQLRSGLQPTESQPCLMLDTFGELASCYGKAHSAVVCGSFNRRGGQNFIEALAAQCPVLVGPSTENFRVDVAEARAFGVLLQVNDADELWDELQQLINRPQQREAFAQRAAAFMASQRGAIARTNSHLVDLGMIQLAAEEPA